MVETNCFVFITGREKRKKKEKEHSNSTRSQCIIHHTEENNLSPCKRFDVKYNEAPLFSDETEGR